MVVADPVLIEMGALPNKFCIICGEEGSEVRFYTFECGHSAMIDCLKQDYVSVLGGNLKEVPIFKCMVTKCAKVVPYHQVVEILGDQV